MRKFPWGKIWALKVLARGLRPRFGRPQIRPRLRLAIESLEGREVPSITHVYAVGADAGGFPQVKVLDAQGHVKFSFLAYDAAFTGGVRVATGDVLGTGVDAIVTAPGPGGVPDIRVFDGATGQLMRNFLAYDASFTGGVYGAVADVNRDGYADIITGAGAGGGPHVKVFSGKDGALLRSFMAYDTSFTGGVRVAGGDFNGDNRADIVTAAGPGGGPDVRVYNGADGTLMRQFFAYDASFTGGVYVACADVMGDGTEDLITGAGAGGGPHVKVFSGKDGSLLRSFMAYDTSFTGGVRVGASYFALGQPADILTAPGPGGGPDVRVYDARTLQPVDTLLAYDAAWTSGVYVNGSSTPNVDTVLTWNSILLHTIWDTVTQPPDAARAMAMVQGAVYDAVNAIDRTHQPYHAKIAAPPPGASEDAAAAVAAERVLASLFPALTNRFNAALTDQLAIIPNGPGKDNGANVGIAAANDMIAWRSTDGANKVVPYTPGFGPGQYQLTPPGYLPSLDPQWPQLTPFAMTSDTQFRPAGPPALNSAAYADAFNKTKSLGDIHSTTRTPDQTLYAHFWADVPGNSVTPPGHWNEIAEVVSIQHGVSLVDNARLFALLDIGEADAGIVSWDSKYAYNFWRPITAIRNADPTVNPQTIPDPTWNSLWVSPPFPSYDSGHSSFSGAADAILTSFFGPNTSFTISSDDVPNATRSFTSFTQAANEAGESRVVGGIHFEFDNQDGLASCRALGNYIVGKFLLPVPPGS
jgi:hypothetical protein